MTAPEATGEGQSGETPTAPEGDALSDDALCDAVRGGELWPLATLWQRYHGVALAWARGKDLDHADDAVAEAFDSVFRALAQGGGPTQSFSSYLFRSISTQLSQAWGAKKRVETLEGFDVADPTLLGGDDLATDREEQDAAAAALEELPLRWKQIILEVDVGGRPVQEVADELELTPNSTSVLLKRARTGLKKSWLKNMHPPRGLNEECAACVADFSEVRWGKRNSRRRAKAEEHIAGCRNCKSRWRRFSEQATTIGMVSAGVLAIDRKSRRGAVTATVAAGTFLVTAGFMVPVLFGGGLFPQPVPIADPLAPWDRAIAEPSGDGSSESGGSSSRPGGDDGQQDASGGDSPTGEQRGDSARDLPGESGESGDPAGSLTGGWFEEIPNSASVNVNDLDLDGDGTPGAETETVWSRWGGAELRKVDAEAQTRGLSGARFHLWVSDRTSGCVDDPGLELVETASGEPYEVASGTGGVVTLTGLWIGDDERVDGTDVHSQMQRCYVLEEIAAPAGYVLPNGDARLTEVVIGIGTEDRPELLIPNSPERRSELSATGAIASCALVVAGTMLIVGATLVLVRNRRASSAIDRARNRPE